MRQSDNTPNIFKKYQEYALRTPAIENGNTPLNSRQGKIYTSEISFIDGYSANYEAAITSSTLGEFLTGQRYNAFIVIDYSVDLIYAGGNPGLFGSDIIKENDVFTIAGPSRDYVRGVINKIENVTWSVAGTIYSYTYTLNCTINQGDPTTISNSDTFFWKRQIFQDKTNFNEAYSPINLSSSYDRNTGDIYFFWDDVQKESRRYRIKVRDSQTSNPPSYFYLDVNGTQANGDTDIQIFLDGSGAISTAKIVKAGKSIHSNRSINIIGTGTGATGYAVFNQLGELIKNEFMVYDGIIGANTIFVTARTTTPEAGGYPIANVGSFIEGLPSLGGLNDFYALNVTPISPREFSIDLGNASGVAPIVINSAWLADIKGSNIKTHDGVILSSLGTGYFGKAVCNIKKLPERTRFYYDASFWGPLTPGSLQAWCVSAIYDEINKLYTEWTIEDYIQL